LHAIMSEPANTAHCMVMATAVSGIFCDAWTFLSAVTGERH
jgi:hypothetical protein